MDVLVQAAGRTSQSVLNTPCASQAGIVIIREDINYELPRDFSVFRHTYKHLCMHKLISSRAEFQVNGVADGEFLYKIPGPDDYKRHAIWLVPLPLPPDVHKWSASDIWCLGKVHVITGASSVGHACSHIQPKVERRSDVVGDDFVLCRALRSSL